MPTFYTNMIIINYVKSKINLTPIIFTDSIDYKMLYSKTWLAGYNTRIINKLIAARMFIYLGCNIFMLHVHCIRVYGYYWRIKPVYTYRSFYAYMQHCTQIRFDNLLQKC